MNTLSKVFTLSYEYTSCGENYGFPADLFVYEQYVAVIDY